MSFVKRSFSLTKERQEILMKYYVEYSGEFSKCFGNYVRYNPSDDIGEYDLTDKFEEAFIFGDGELTKMQKLVDFWCLSEDAKYVIKEVKDGQ